MEHLAPIIVDLAIMLGVASIVMLCCIRLKQPLVLGYLIAGMIVGPYTPPYMLVSDIPGIKTIAELGVIFLMFSMGLDFSFHKLKKIGKPALGVGLFEVLFMIGVGYGLGRLLHWSPTESLFLGAALSISSTTIIIKALNELHLKNAPFAHLIFGVLIVEDLLAILLLVALPLLAVYEANLTQTLVRSLIKLIVVVSSWFLIGYFVVPILFRRWLKKASDEVLIVVSVALCFAMVCLAAYYGYTVALGAFIMGSILAETEESSRIEHLVQPLRDIYAAVFFVAVGMLINPLQIWQHIGTVLLITGVTIFFKTALSFLGAYGCTRRLSLSTQVGFSMAQIGEFSFIIAALGLSLNLLDASFYPIVVAVSVLTTFTTPYFIRSSVHLANYLQTKEPTLATEYTPTAKSIVSQRLGLPYLLNVITFVIIFTGAGFAVPIDRDFSHHLFANNLIFAAFYLCAAPFITMLFVLALQTKSILFKIMGVGFTLLILFGLMVHRFDSFINFAIWYAIVLFSSLGLKKMWQKLYHWLSGHLLRNLKLS